ncbi:hypothetical protein [Microbacterium sp. NIBRBAC000506063]|nr:hypothetical protein [Microbacterium sp. NIBRBAC000506063]
MSPEKRLLPFLEAVAASGIDADIEVIGGGASGAPRSGWCRSGRPRRR